MKLSKMPKEELESYSYTELAKMIIEEAKKPLSTADIFKKICNLLKLEENVYQSKIGDFYTNLTTDKSFVLIDSCWDLRDHHTSEISLELEEDEEDEELQETEKQIEEEMDDMASETFDDMDDSSEINDPELDTDDLEDDDLTIIEEDELD